MRRAAPCRNVPVTFTLDVTKRPMATLKLLLAAACCFIALNAQAQGSSQAPLDCSAGPTSRAYGGVSWLVYACSDGETVILVSAPGSPAAPFYFTLFRKEGRYVVGGEGTGPRSITDRTYAELSRLTETDVKAMLVAARSAATSKGGR